MLLLLGWKSDTCSVMPRSYAKPVTFWHSSKYSYYVKKGYFLKILPCSGDPRRDMARTLPEFTQTKCTLLLEVSSPVTECCISLMLKSRIRWEEPWRKTHDNKITQLCPSAIQWNKIRWSGVVFGWDKLKKGIVNSLVYASLQLFPQTSSFNAQRAQKR